MGTMENSEDPDEMSHNTLTLSGPETPKQVQRQTVKPKSIFREII